ncbi:hypothetical protein AYO38_03465 [bacterium SCGC AG-212-C10]|nr:hypothetical protein AYO38_03465 [bacterium SCGC AG-212-C10]
MSVRQLSFVFVVFVAGMLGATQHARSSAAAPCDAPILNPIVCENSKDGTPQSDWDVTNGPDPSIVGFATQFSVNHGQTVQFKVKTGSTNYRFDIYRLGYYNGDGARKVATVQPSVSLPQSQPACLSEPATGLVDCGNWSVSASWAVPASAVSGIYLATLVREDPEDGSRNHIVFVVRDDEGHSDLLVQTSDTTWQAYNDYGGNSLYTGSPANRAYKVSYNRPFANRSSSVGGAIESFLFAAEYPMLRFIEANGYNVSYTSGIDTESRGSEILEHKVFVSSGHDEYWSNAQRLNVEAARDAGVNLAFFSGNEIFWKTRWETGIDGSGAPYRTLVTYKETKANAKIDPNSAWTGTWRDPRFSPPADGGRPENVLTGQLFRVNGIQYWVMQVPEADGKMRFWRNTSVATLASGQTADLPLGTLGYEWDESPDNGVQPAGLVRLSTTTYNVSNLYLLDLGNTFGNGIATHNLTLYRAASGAIVFGAGTVNWAWGLDDTHDGLNTPTNESMQQATINLFADMGVQPGSLLPDLVAASQSTDHVKPSSHISSPGAGFSAVTGTAVTVTGTATDSGGRVGAVEVSTDNGATWHFATGRGNWTYTWTPASPGAVTIRTRAVDDSANVETPAAGVSGTVTYGACPCSIWEGAETPAVVSQSDAQPVELGVKFRSEINGYITGVRFYKGPANTGVHTGSLWSVDGTLLATGQFANESAGGWQLLTFSAPVAITANTPYVASYHTNTGFYSLTSSYFAVSETANPPLHALQEGASGPNGVYRYGASAFPNQSYQSGNYWVDAVFNNVYVDTVPPAIVARTPAAGATDVSFLAQVSATLSEAVTPSTVSLTLRRPNGTNVAATTTYDAQTRTATLVPTGQLAAGTTYTATLSGAADPAGNVVASSSWSFTTVACPCSIWPGTTTPAGDSKSDGQPVELGVKFKSDVSGYITGVRFYKGAGNTGTHTGSLWTDTGTLLSTATFTNESATGWQEVSFPAPVAVTANTVYVASYRNPTGTYIVTSGQFVAAGVTRSPLTALQDGAAGGNGVYRYGAPGFPTGSYQGGNYWVDVAFSAIYNDGVAPSVTGRSPAAGAPGIPATATVTATLSEPIVGGSAAFVLHAPGGATVPATVSYDAQTRTASLQPTAPLALGSTYTATVSGAIDLSGNVMASTSWSFTTVVCPCTIWPVASTPVGDVHADGLSLELGVAFKSETNGYIMGIRFYKGGGNTGTHTGNLWTSSGTLLASATFTNESASGWQLVTFPVPVAVSAGTTYVASYFNPTGTYLSTLGYFAAGMPVPGSWPLSAPLSGNGLYRYGASAFPTDSYQGANYWVDVKFNAAFQDEVAPVLTNRTPASGATAIPANNAVTATFSEPITAGSLSFVLRDSGGTPVPATVSYDPQSRIASLQPTAVLALGSTYTATVSGASDPSGNVMTSTSWTFTTVACPCSLWPSGTTPVGDIHFDGTSLELGVTFKSDISGYITGIRFYKAAGDTGTHTGSLWTSSGTLLAAATFTAESASGWQVVTFPAPVAVTAGTSYVASYFTPTGTYLSTPGYFLPGMPAVGSWPLSAPLTGGTNVNGLYRYGASAFPTNSYQGGNYWVDVLFAAN